MKLKIFNRPVSRILLGFLFICSPQFLAQASMAIPSKESKKSGLERLSKADLIFRGLCEEKRKDTVTDSKTGKELPVVVYSFSVVEVLKGGDLAKIEVPQLDIHSRREAFRLGYLGGLQSTTFEVGKEYLLFLGKPSERLGLRPLYGGDEGKYTVEKDEKGEEIVTHPKGIKGFPKPITKNDLKKGGITIDSTLPKRVPYKSFTSKIKSHIHE